MTTPPVRVERRAGQRFPYLLPLTLRQPDSSVEGLGLTQDVSSRGVFFLTDAHLAAGAEVEITLRMPSEVTLGQSMLVRCRGHVLRVMKASTAPLDASGATRTETKIGVAVRFEHYEYLPESESSMLPRVSALHPHLEEKQPPPNAVRPILG